MDQTDLDFSNERNFLTQEPGAAWRAAGGAFDFRFVKLSRSDHRSHTMLFQGCK